MERRQRCGMPTDQAGDDRDRGKDPPTFNDPEAGGAEQLQLLSDRPVARVLHLARRPDESSRQQEMQARLEVREVRHRDEGLSL